MSRPTPLLAALALAAVVIPATAQHTGQTHTTHTTSAKTTKATTPLPLTVRDATVLAVPPGATETSALMTLRNTSKTPVILSGARTPLARHTMLMTTHKDARGRLGMSAVKTLTVPAGATLTLRHDGDHLMLMDLTRTPRVGETVRLTLISRDGRTLNLNAAVRMPGMNH